MALPKSGIRIPREPIAGSEGLWAKMTDPGRLGPPTPDMLDLAQIGLTGTPLNPKIPAGVRANPVPSVMEAAGMYNPVAPHTLKRSLMHGITLPTWDAGQPGRPTELNWYLFADDSLVGTVTEPQSLKLQGANAPIYPAPTFRVPRGAVFHAHTDCQGPPPHTIHWHGIEPTPMNDGVGHCSFEVEGSYTYQWQPNFIGTYFYHCHRNTVMHFEYGLLGYMLFDPPDAFFASIDHVIDPLAGTVVLNNIPLGHGRPEPGFPLGRRRTAANLNFPGLPAFPGFVGGDPVRGVVTPDPLGQFRFDPHAFTVPYEVEALWVLDDRSSEWSLATKDAFATFPVNGTFVGGVVQGINDGWHNQGKGLGQVAPDAFFGFNDFNADYWFVTGVPLQAHRGGVAAIPAGLVYEPPLNSGVVGSQVSIQANVGDTVFVRCLDAAYNNIRTTFPVDTVIIEWDGRALGVPPLNQYTRPILVKAGDPIVHCTARRWGLIFRSTVPVDSFAKVEFIDSRSTNTPNLTTGGDVLVTAMIPIQIN